MKLHRPLECPACGHERIVRRSEELRAESGQIRVRVPVWECGLCDYRWSAARGGRPDRSGRA